MPACVCLHTHVHTHTLSLFPESISLHRLQVREPKVLASAHSTALPPPPRDCIQPVAAHIFVSPTPPKTASSPWLLTYLSPRPLRLHPARGCSHICLPYPRPETASSLWLLTYLSPPSLRDCIQPLAAHIFVSPKKCCCTVCKTNTRLYVCVGV